MAADLAELVRPGHTAVLTMEMQRGVVGDEAVIPDLAAEVRVSGVISNAARLLDAARLAGVAVVHCTFETRADRLGLATNAPLLAAMSKGSPRLVPGSAAAAVVPELGPAESDLVSSRSHGVSPFIGTSLDATLRNLGVRTVVATGVSVNLGVLGLAVEAVNFGYRVVVVRDAVAGLPADYAAEVMKRTIALVATRATVDDLIAVW